MQSGWCLLLLHSNSTPSPGYREPAPQGSCISTIPGMAGSSLLWLGAQGSGIPAWQVTGGWCNHLPPPCRLVARLNPRPACRAWSVQPLATLKHHARETEKPKALTALGIAGVFSHHIHIVWWPDHFLCYEENPSGLSLPGKNVIPEPKYSHGFSPGQTSEAEFVVARPCFILVSISIFPVWRSGLPQHWQCLLTS